MSPEMDKKTMRCGGATDHPEQSDAMRTFEQFDKGVIFTLFSALDSVLHLRSLRNQQAFHSEVRRHVESATGRELSDDRLWCVLGLAGRNVIDVKWIKSGKDARLEFFQRDKEGNVRSPTLKELEQRKDDFKIALATAEKLGKFPVVVLPERPDANTSIVNTIAMPVLPDLQAKKTDMPLKVSDAATRKEALLERVRARQSQVAELQALEKKYEEIRRRIAVCDDAEIVHKLLQSLFARGEGKSSAASEEEILKVLCSASFGMQCVKALDRPAAQQALNLLTEKSLQWFSVQAGIHNPDAKYFRRLPEGRAADALASVQEERSNLSQKLRELCESASRRDTGAVVAPCVSKDRSATRMGLKRALPSESANTPAQAPSKKSRQVGESLESMEKSRPTNDSCAVQAGRTGWMLKRLRKKTCLVVA